MVLSSLTLAELEAAPAKVQAVIKAVPKQFIDYIEFTQDASELAEVYLREGVVTKKCRIDAQREKGPVRPGKAACSSGWESRLGNREPRAQY